MTPSLNHLAKLVVDYLIFAGEAVGVALLALAFIYFVATSRADKEG